MSLVCSRYLALVLAVGLAIGEAVINWGDWQYAPLWIVDYIIVGWLLWGFFQTRTGHQIHVLLSGWAFAAGVFYLALFIGLDPEYSANEETNGVLMFLIGLLLAGSVVGFWSSALAIRVGLRAVRNGGPAVNS